MKTERYAFAFKSLKRKKKEGFCNLKYKSLFLSDTLKWNRFIFEAVLIFISCL